MNKTNNIKSRFSAFNLRLAIIFKKALENAAKENERSLHAEIIHRLKNSFK